MGLESVLARKLPGLKRSLRMAHLKDAPELYVKKAMRLAMYGSLAVTAAIFFGTVRMLAPASVATTLLVAAPLSFLLIFVFLVNAPRGITRKRQREIEKDVLFEI